MRKLLLGLAACFLAFVLLSFFIERTIVFVPEAKVTILSKDRATVPNWRVTQVWNHYSYEDSTGHQETRYTDGLGVVVFPERTVRVTLVRQFLGIVQTLLGQFVPHASSGPHSYIFTDRSYNGITYRGSGTPGGEIHLMD